MASHVTIGCRVATVAEQILGRRRLSRPKSSRRSRNGDRWAAIACIAQLGSATAVAGRRQLSRHGDIAERRQPWNGDSRQATAGVRHQSATAYSITIGLSRRLALATPVAKWRAIWRWVSWRWVSPNGDGVAKYECRRGDDIGGEGFSRDGCRRVAIRLCNRPNVPPIHRWARDPS